MWWPRLPADQQDQAVRHLLGAIPADAWTAAYRFLGWDLAPTNWRGWGELHFGFGIAVRNTLRTGRFPWLEERELDGVWKPLAAEAMRRTGAPATGVGRRVLVVGDVHGCWVELGELVERAGLGADDAVLLVGDAVDRGPESPEVWGYLEGGSVLKRSVQGNHERKHLRSGRGEIAPSLSQVITRRQMGEEAYAAALHNMAVWSLHADLPEAHVVHAYVEPGVPFGEQRAVVLTGTMSGDHYLRRTYERPLGKEWYRLYAEDPTRDKPVIVGHHDVLGTGAPLVHRDRVYMIDTSCVLGGKLTGVLLPEWRIVQVTSRADHWAAVRAWAAGLDLPRPTRTPKAPRPTRKERRAAAAARAAASPPWDPASEELVAAVLRRVAEEHRRVLDHLVEDREMVLGFGLDSGAGYGGLPAREQGLLFAAAVRGHPLAALLHRARLGAVTPADVRRVCGTPQHLRELARQAGLP